MSAAQSPSESQQPHGAVWHKLRLAGPLLSAVVLVLGMLLSFDGSRSWLTEAGNVLFMKREGNLAPYRLKQKPGIAVLPFVNMSSDAGNEYFSDGMSEEILNALPIPIACR